MTTITKNKAASETSVAVGALAVSFARIGAKNEAFLHEIDVTLAAKEVTQKGALSMLLRMQDAYKPEELDAMPVPDTEDGNNPAKRKRDVQDPKTGETKSITEDFYSGLFDNLPVGDNISKTLDAISNALSGGKDGPVDKTLPSDQAGLIRLRKTLVGRRQAGRGLLKRTMKLYHQYNAVDEMDSVQLDVATEEKDGKEIVSGTTYPITIFNKADMKQFRPFSISSFLALDVAEAVAAGGSWQNLMDTMGRDKGGSTGDGIPPVTLKTFESFLSGVANFVDDHLGQISKKLDAKDGKDTIVTLVDLYVALTPLYEKHKAEYDRIVMAAR